jgi:hypothetical protein
MASATPIATTQRASYASVVKGTLTSLPLPTGNHAPAPSSHRTHVSAAKRANASVSLPVSIAIPVPVPRIVFRRRPQAHHAAYAQRSALNPRAPPFYPTPAQTPTPTTRTPTPFNPLAPVFTPRRPAPTVSATATATATAIRSRIIPATPRIPAGRYRLLRRSPGASDSTASTRGGPPLSASASSWFASPWSVSPWSTSPWTTPPSTGASLAEYSLAGHAVASSLLLALLRSGSEPVGEGPMKDFGPIGGPVRRERIGAGKTERKRLMDFIKERTARRVERLWG